MSARLIIENMIVFDSEANHVTNEQPYAHIALHFCDSPDDVMMLQIKIPALRSLAQYHEGSTTAALILNGVETAINITPATDGQAYLSLVHGPTTHAVVITPRQIRWIFSTLILLHGHQPTRPIRNVSDQLGEHIPTLTRHSTPVGLPEHWIMLHHERTTGGGYTVCYNMHRDRYELSLSPQPPQQLQTSDFTHATTAYLHSQLTEHHPESTGWIEPVQAVENHLMTDYTTPVAGTELII